MGRSNLGGTIIVTWPITGTDIDSAASIPASAMQFNFSRHFDFGLDIASTPVAKDKFAFKCNSSGVITGVHAMVITPGSSASVTVDVKKNGTTILSSVITLTNASAANTTYDGTLSTTTFAAGDKFTIHLGVSSSTGMQGVNAWINGYETSQPI